MSAGYLTENVKVRVTPELLAWLEVKAEQENRKVGAMIRVLLYEAKLREEEMTAA